MFFVKPGESNIIAAAILMCIDLIVELGIFVCTSMGLEPIALHNFKLHSLEKFH